MDKARQYVRSRLTTGFRVSVNGRSQWQRVRQHVKELLDDALLTEDWHVADGARACIQSNDHRYPGIGLFRSPVYDHIVRAMRAQYPVLADAINATGCFAWLYRDRGPDGAAGEATCDRDGIRSSLCALRAQCQEAHAIGAPDEAVSLVALQARAVRSPEHAVPSYDDIESRLAASYGRSEYVNLGQRSDWLRTSLLVTLGDPPSLAVHTTHWGEEQQRQVFEAAGPLVIVSHRAYTQVRAWGKSTHSEFGAYRHIARIYHSSQWHLRVAISQEACDALCAEFPDAPFQRASKANAEGLDGCTLVAWVREKVDALRLARVLLELHGVKAEAVRRCGVSFRQAQSGS